MGIKLSEKMANELHSEHCDFERYGTKCTCGTQALVDEVSQLEAKNAALKRENGRLRDGIRDVRKHIAPMHTAYDMLLILLAQGSE